MGGTLAEAQRVNWAEGAHTVCNGGTERMGREELFSGDLENQGSGA